MDFYKKFEKQCRIKGVSLTKACLDLGLSTTMISKYRGGSVPRNSTIMDMATYFGCDLTDLLETDDPPTPTDKDYYVSPPWTTFQQFLSVASMLNEREIKRVTNFAYQVLGERKD